VKGNLNSQTNWYSEEAWALLYDYLRPIVTGK